MHDALRSDALAALLVATEVPALARRGANAARNIQDPISSRAQQVKQGAALVRRAGGGTTQDIVNANERLTAIRGVMHSAANVRASGIAEVGVAVGDTERVTQQIAARVEQSAAAAESLRPQAEELMASVAALQPASASRQGIGATRALAVPRRCASLFIERWVAGLQGSIAQTRP